jgi:hypothetical protein
MKNILFVLITALIFSGCAVFDTVYEISEIFSDGPPVPVCDSDSAGVRYDGRVCVKYSDGVYRWANE